MAASRPTDARQISSSSYFLRLSGKTQLVPAPFNEGMRNRYTHSLEVRKIALEIAAHLEAEQSEPRIDRAAVEAAALAHDVGHAPFGHVAERQLDRLSCLDGGFESNAQAVHILLGPHYSLYPVTLAALVKYRTEIPHHAPERTEVIKGVYEKDFPALDAAVCSVEPGLEWQVVDLADDIGNAIFDIHDLVRFHGRERMADLVRTELRPQAVLDRMTAGDDRRDVVKETLFDLEATLIPGMLAEPKTIEWLRLRRYLDSWTRETTISGRTGSSPGAVTTSSKVLEKIDVLRAVVAITFLQTDINRRFDDYIECNVRRAFDVVRGLSRSRVEELAAKYQIHYGGPLAETRDVVNFLHQLKDTQLLAVADSTTVLRKPVYL